MHYHWHITSLFPGCIRFTRRRILKAVYTLRRTVHPIPFTSRAAALAALRAVCWERGERPTVKRYPAPWCKGAK